MQKAPAIRKGGCDGKHPRCASCSRRLTEWIFALQVYKQKVKHLLYEHQNNINILKADGELSMKLAADEAAKVEGELQKDKRALKLELKEQVGRGRNARHAWQGLSGVWLCERAVRAAEEEQPQRWLFRSR